MDEETRRPADPAAGGRLSDDPDRPSVNPAVTTPVGAVAGAAAGMAAGTITAGPVGTIVGALVGLLGGGWAGAATAAAAQPTEEDETYYREHYRGATSGMADAAYERARPAYHLGHVAALNPDYRGRRFEDVEADLQRGWTDDVRARHGEWSSARAYVRAAFDRTLRRTNAGPGDLPADTPVGTTPSHDHASYSDPLSASADVAGNPNATEPLGGAPERSGGSSPGWMRSPVDQGGFGQHRDPDSVRESARQTPPGEGRT